MDRGDAAFGTYLAANVAWAIAAVLDLGGVYAVADALCVVAAAFLLAGWRRRSPALLALGAVATLACQGPFYARGFAAGPIGVAGQVLFLASLLALLVAAWAWRGGPSSRALGALRVAGGLMVLDGAAFILAEGTLASVWQPGNVLSEVAGIPLAMLGALPPRRADRSY